jgi:hypothetical protein
MKGPATIGKLKAEFLGKFRRICPHLVSPLLARNKRPANMKFGIISYSLLVCLPIYINYG